MDGVFGPGGNSHVHVYIWDSATDLAMSQTDEFTMFIMLSEYILRYLTYTRI